MGDMDLMKRSGVWPPLETQDLPLEAQVLQRSLKRQPSEFAPPERFLRILSPVPFDKDPAAIAANVAVRYPSGVRTRPGLPSAAFPSIGVPAPTMIAGNPHMVSTGRRRPSLDSSEGRRDSNHDIGGWRAECQYSSENTPHQSSTKHIDSLSLGHRPIFESGFRTASNEKAP